jgi:hypothetical protein
MKKLLLFGLGVVASLGSLTSCKKDEAVAAPTITFLNGVNSYTAKEVDTAYTFVADVEAAGEISSIKIFDVTVEGIETQVSSITKFDSDTKHEVKYTVKLSEVDNFKKFKISVTDKKDMSYSASFLINAYTKPAGDITTYTATLLGSQYASTGSFFSTTNGQVYTVNTSAASSSLIDLIYYYSGDGTVGNGATIGGADDTNILGVYTGIANWTTKNATRFATTSMTTTEFDALANDAKISTLSTFADTKEIGLTVGSVIAFKTVGGKKGVLKVTNLTKGTNTQNQQQDFQFGTIEIVVKVQK